MFDDLAAFEAELVRPGNVDGAAGRGIPMNSALWTPVIRILATTLSPSLIMLSTSKDAPSNAVWNISNICRTPALVGSTPGITSSSTKLSEITSSTTLKSPSLARRKSSRATTLFASDIGVLSLL